MAKTRMVLELGMGTSLRKMDYTAAAARAVENALWRNSLNVAQAFGFPRDAMIVDVDVAVQDPDAIDPARIAALFPYGDVNVTTSLGGLDVPKPDGSGATLIAQAAIVVSFDMEAAQ